MNGVVKWVVVLGIGGGLLGGAWVLRESLIGDGPRGGAGQGGPIAVEVAPVEHGAIEHRRELSGTIEAAAEFVVAPKVGGRVERIVVDLADVVQRGQVVAVLDDAEFRQAEEQAKANLSVAQAESLAANKGQEIAKRNFDRVAGLRKKSLVSAQDLDTALADKLGADARVAVAASEVKRARASLREAQVRKDYARVTADWPEGDHERVVAARYADEGATITANTSLLSIVDLDPVVVVVQVTERDYADLAPGQKVRISTGAYPGQTFDGTVDRIAPVFRSDSRQARVELQVPNQDGRLRPGMFARATMLLGREDDATLVPEDALIKRGGSDAVFVVSDDGRSVALHSVEVGFSEEGRVAVRGEGIEGRVVVLGQQRLQDGSAITIPDGATP